MRHDEYVAAIRREGDAFTTAAETAGLDAPVPSCPEWTVADLVSHVGRIHRYVTSIVQQRPAPPEVHWSATEPPPLAERLDWFRDGYPALADALGAADPSEAVWTWTDDHTIGFWSRRQAHELAVHRWDAQAAAGTTAPIKRELAVDGIQESLDIVPARGLGAKFVGNGETIHLHCTDGEGEWLLRLTPDGLVVTNEHAKGDVAARGTASDLLLMMWGRLPSDAVEVFGDASVLARWQELARF
jgi:uncharacterized protein (TIGR03083 family)